MEDPTARYVSENTVDIQVEAPPPPNTRLHLVRFTPLREQVKRNAQVALEPFARFVEMI